jgi:AcrR family transcriptional regulator
MSIASLRHRPGTYLRGEETRRRILGTALEMFAEQGYEATSTRLLAERAGVNLPAIPYYFGSKEGLYRAVVAHCLEQSETFLAPVTAKAMALLEKKDTPADALIDVLCEIFERFVVLVSCGEQVEARRLLWARAEVERTPVLQMLQEGGKRQIFEPCTALVGRLFGRAPEDPATVLRTLALFGQATIFCHTGVQQVLGEARIDEDWITAVRALVRSQTEAILRAALPGKGGASKARVSKTRVSKK